MNNALKPHYIYIALLILSTILSVLFLTFFSMKTTAALSGSDFNPGRIIDDAVFQNETAMSVSQIQNFLNSKVPVCDTDGTQPYADTTRALYGASRGNPAPFICLKDYSENVRAISSSEGYCSGSTTSGTKTAAQIIYDVAQACDINPQVLIVMLQKEQSLITDDWPWDRQYEIAMGYGCPDTAPCDEQYYGFFNQVWQAANAFKRYETNPTWYNYRAGRNNAVYYHPDLSRCGSSTVYIENQATAGLYIYTPYQPNQAALNNLYGTGDSCSSYGNRNFWRMFNDWFGTTEGTPFFKVEGDNKTYILGSNNNYYHVDTYEKLTAYGYGKHFEYKATYSSAYLNNKTYSGKLPIYARFEGSHVYLVDRGGKYYFNSRTLLEETYGYVMGEEALLPSYLSYYLPDSGDVRNVIKEHGGSMIYVMENGKRRRVADIDAFQTGSPPYSTLPYVSLSTDYMKSLPATFPILGANKIIYDYKKGSYGYWDGSKFYNISRITASDLGIRGDYNLSSNEYSNLPRHSEPVVTLVKSSTPSYYVLSGGLKLKIPSSELNAYGLLDSDFVSTPDYFLTRLNNGRMSRIITVSGSRSKYLISGQGRKHFNSRQAVAEQGLSYSDILDISSHTANSFPENGKVVFGTGTMFKISGSSKTYIINSSGTKLYINSSEMISDYGLSKASVRTVSPTMVADYPNSGTLSAIARDSTDNVWVVVDGLRYLVPNRQLDSSRHDIDVEELDKVSSWIYSNSSYAGELKDIICDSSNGRKYYVENGQKRWLTSPDAIYRLGLTYNDITYVSNLFIKSIPTGSNIN